MFSKRCLKNYFRVGVYFTGFAAKTFDRTVPVLIIKLLQVGFQPLPNLLQALPQWVPQVKSASYKARTLSIPLQAHPQGVSSGWEAHQASWTSGCSKAPEPCLKLGLETFPYSLSHTHGSCKQYCK